jgi:hypothetical protein
MGILCYAGVWGYLQTKQLVRIVDLCALTRYAVVLVKSSIGLAVLGTEREPSKLRRGRGAAEHRWHFITHGPI